jgi:RNA ligase (TIGR02306 family)
MTRKLASIQRIVKLEPIEGADLIQKATVLNWQLVTAKDNGFQEGDMIVFIEPDAFVPHELAPFLSKGQEPKEYNGIKGERLRTIKLRKQVSQGLILPMFVLTNYGADLVEGSDVTETLGIQKWEPPVSAQLAGVTKGNWPDGLPKTDQDRIQTFSNREFDELKLHWYEVTEKLEGSSGSIGFIKGEFTVCSRNINLKEVEGNTFWKVARQYDIEAKMAELALDNIVIQGEVIGEGVQGNHYKIKGHQFFVFDIYDLVKGEYLSPKDRREMASKLGLLHSPVLADITLEQFVTVQDVLVFADGVSVLNNDVLREGVVFKQHDGNIHFKAVSSKYLLKTGE